MSDLTLIYATTTTTVLAIAATLLTFAIAFLLAYREQADN
jgi:hypothetical protein